MKKLVKILKKENYDNYSDIGFLPSEIISQRERLLARIEKFVFGNTDIQRSEYDLLLKKNNIIISP